ncbi:MAG: zinc-dependent alcohol dehydrogenase [Planctomycetota bacterium]|jgi:threonine dehydrogenase-like Zn-dependent dehydrogenase
MRAVAVIEPGRVSVIDLAEPVPGPYQARVKTEAACLCNATDGKLVAGHFPGVNDYPLILGHESAGIVDAVGPKVRNFKEGDRVIGGLLFDFADAKYASGWGGFCEYTLAVDHDAMVEDGVADEAHGWLEVYEIQRPVPPEVALEEAVMLCTWREVYGGFGDFQLGAGDHVLIFGAGPVGLSFVKFGKLLGLSYVGAVDPLPHKREKALAMGADEVFEQSPEASHFANTQGRPLDAVVDAVGNPAIANAGLPLVKMGGSICIYGVIADESIALDKGKGPYNFNLFMHQWPTRSREKAAQEPLCEWIRQGKITAGELITHDFPVERVTDALEAVGRGEVIKAILRY